MKIVRAFIKRLVGYGSDRKSNKIASASIVIIAIITSLLPSMSNHQMNINHYLRQKDVMNNEER